MAIHKRHERRGADQGDKDEKGSEHARLLGGRFVGGLSSFYAAAREKASAARSGEMLLDGSPIEQRANRLRVLSSALSSGNHEKAGHRAGQIAELKAG